MPISLRYRSFCLTSVCFLATFGSTPLARADIVGGEEVAPSDPIRSSTAALYSPGVSGRGGALCTASVIGKDIAVTAAHCIAPGGPAPVMLFGGDVHSSKTAKRPVTGEIVNSNWRKHAGKGMDQGDIALVKFRGGLPAGYSPVETLDSDATIRKGNAVILAGFGISNARAKTGAGVLRKTKVGVASPRSGKSEMILDQSRGHGACHGDSGGPAFVRRKGKLILAGVTNRSYPAGAPDDCGHRVVYTKISAYRSWIKKGEARLHSNRGNGVSDLKKKMRNPSRPRRTKVARLKRKVARHRRN